MPGLPWGPPGRVGTYLNELIKERGLLEEKRFLLRVLAHLVREVFERLVRLGRNDHQQAAAALLEVPRQIGAGPDVARFLRSPQILVRHSVVTWK